MIFTENGDDWHKRSQVWSKGLSSRGIFLVLDLGHHWPLHWETLQVLDSLPICRLHLGQLLHLPAPHVGEAGVHGLGAEHQVLDEVDVDVVQVELVPAAANEALELLLKDSALLLKKPHSLDCSHHLLHVTFHTVGDICMKAKHLISHHPPLLQVEHFVASHNSLVEVNQAIKA